MHTIAQRINAVSAVATTTIIFLVAGIALIGLFEKPVFEPARIEISDVEVLWGHDRRDHFDRRDREWTNFRFAIEADLRPIFRYNTKQIFVYLVADYSTPEFPSNEVVLWDRIIRNPRDAKINLSGARNKYAFKHIGGSFKLSLFPSPSSFKPSTDLFPPAIWLHRDVNATYTLHYNLMPKVGALTWGVAGQTKDPVPFPPVNYRKPLNR
ncbi:hypothetical protein PSTT_09511 [Puccinia striiformis]|uniref:Signal peptidase subunit 3 n=1 Tax=Puccinia striiformis TaxID=27350 RepID=A0A2S4V8C6_9BASI|nr:hypothetical protein PSTT_09511 [Puccinia striiformis]